MVAALLSGILLGLAAGISPGPLLALLIAQTLRYGPREGCKIALSPLLTDAPIILLVWFLASWMRQVDWLLGLISVAGGMYVFYLAFATWQPSPPVPAADAPGARSWSKGMITNLLNPNPWLFWLTAGAATLGNAMSRSWMAAIAFLAGFYLFLVGSKIALALGVGASRQILSGPAYRRSMRLLAVLLAVCGGMMIHRGAARFGGL